MTCQRIFIVENIPSLNKGEFTIFEGIFESFKLLGPIKIAMLSPLIEIDAQRYNNKIELIELPPYIYYLNNNILIERILKIITSLFFIFKHFIFLFFYSIFGIYVLKIFRAEIWKKFVESDILLIGHDGVFGLGGGEGMPIFLYPVFIPFFGKLLNKKTVLFGGSVTYPKKYKMFVKPFLRFGLNNFDLITLREEISYNNCIKLGIKNKNLHVTSDLAYLMTPIEGKRIEEIMQIENISSNPPIIGITVTYHKAIKTFSKKSKNDSYYCHNKLYAEVIDDVITRLDVQIIFLPHSIGFGKELDDRIISKDIYKLCHYKKRIKIIENEYDAKELKGLIGTFDLLIAERLHSAINAISMNIPTLIVSNIDDQRLDIIKIFGQEQLILYLNNLGKDEFLNKIMKIYENRFNIKSQLKQQFESTYNRAKQNGILLNKLIE